MLSQTPIEARARSLIQCYGSREAEKLSIGWTKQVVYLPTGGTALQDRNDADATALAKAVRRLNEVNGMLAPPAFGPYYPKELGGATVARFRRQAMKAGSVIKMDLPQRRAYAEAVEKAILAKQRSELQRELPGHACPCASGTWHSDGRKISEAVRRQHTAELLAYPAKVRAERPDHIWRSMYAKAMEEKRNRLLTTEKASSDCTPRAADSAVPAAQRGKPQKGAATMNRSKIYPVKSNAARAAAQYGLTRGNLFEVSNSETGEKGWAFSIPEGVTPTPQKKKAKGEATAADAPKPEKPKAEPKAKKPAKAKPAKASKAKKPAKPAKAKTKAKRTASGPRTGKTAEFIGECKRGYVSADDAMKRYGWNSNTLRGVLGNHKLKTAKTDRPETFIRKREDGKTFYRVLSVDAAEKLAKAA